jgi:hypothetical protein
MCCSASGYYYSDIDGECPHCGEPTVDGDAYENCSYSPTQCDTCGYSPCDESC